MAMGGGTHGGERALHHSLGGDSSGAARRGAGVNEIGWIEQLIGAGNLLASGVDLGGEYDNCSILRTRWGKAATGGPAGPHRLASGFVLGTDLAPQQTIVCR